MRWLLLSLLLAACLPSRGQYFSTQHYTVEDGLPSNRVYELYRDRKGYLWFATDKGVARYNGVRFEVFTRTDGLTCNDVFSFCEDYDGRLWFLSYNGTLCFYRDGKIHNATTDAFLKKDYRTGHMENTVLQYDSSITFLLSGGSAFISVKHDHKKVYPLASFNADNDIRKIAADRYEIAQSDRDTAWIIDTFNHITHTLPTRMVKAIWGQGQRYYYDKDSVYGSRNGPALFPLNPLIGKTPSEIMRRIYRSMDHRWFIATNNGIYTGDGAHLLPGRDIYAITQDIEGNYWISEKKNGVYKVSDWERGTKCYPDQYSRRCIHAFANDSDLYFSTTDNNVYRFHEGRTEPVFYSRRYRPAPPFPPQEAYGLLTGTGDYYTFFDRDLFRIADIQSPNRNVKYFHSKLPSHFTKSLFYFNDTVFAHNIFGILKLHFLPGQHIREEALFSSTARIYAADMDTAGNIWYSGADAIYKYSAGRQERQRQFGNTAFKVFRFCGPYLLGITHDDRLLLCNSAAGPVQIDTIDNHDFVCDKFYLLDPGHVLLNTNGFYRVLRLYPPGHVPRYTLQTIDNPLIPRQAEYVCRNGRSCFFLFMGNIYEISFGDLLRSSLPPRLFFTTLQSGRRLLQLDGLQGTISLPYTRADNIDIRFDVLSFRNKEVICEYSLSRTEQDRWLPTRDERIRIPDPGYGSYVVKVRVRTPGSAFSVPVQLRLYIRKPYWASWWFIAGAIAGLVLLAGFVVRYRVTRMLRKREEQHRDKIKFLQLEYKAQNALMNPHFIFNTLNSVQALINRNDGPAATAYLKTFSDLVRQNMHNISDGLISLQREMDLVMRYLQLEQLRFKELLNYTIEISDTVDTEDILIPPLLIQPLVENAIRHGLLPLQSPESHLQIRIYEQGYDLYIEITDNGVGLHYQSRNGHAHSSFGLGNIRRRIAQLAQLHRISIDLDLLPADQGKERGTRAVLIIRAPAD